jgi:glucose-6-phosphate 1-epimerase
MLWQVPQKLASGMGVGQPRNTGRGFQRRDPRRTENALTRLLDFWSGPSLPLFPVTRSSNMDTVSVAAELDHKFGIAGVAEVSEANGGMPRVRITSALGEGEVYLHGAHVTSWKPAGNDEVLFVSTKSRWQEGQAIRGGIPICFPWFRAKGDDRQAPAHGFARTKTWQIESIVQNEGRVSLSMFTESDEQTRRWWPGEFRLTHRVTFGPELQLELICRNTGTRSLRFEEALHTYNRVADVGQVRLQGLDTVRFLDNTDSNKEKAQTGEVAITSQTDSAYMNTGSAVDLLDPGMRRRIRLHKENSLTTVVWNPWRESAVGLRDLGDGEWKQFLCVEASNILASTVGLDPGQEHKMTAVLSVAKL